MLAWFFFCEHLFGQFTAPEFISNVYKCVLMHQHKNTLLSKIMEKFNQLRYYEEKKERKWQSHQVWFILGHNFHKLEGILCAIFFIPFRRDRFCVPKTKSIFLCVKSLKPRSKVNVKMVAEAGKRVSLSTVNGVLQVSPEGKKNNHCKSNIKTRIIVWKYLGQRRYTEGDQYIKVIKKQKQVPPLGDPVPVFEG